METGENVNKLHNLCSEVKKSKEMEQILIGMFFSFSTGNKSHFDRFPVDA